MKTKFKFFKGYEPIHRDRYNGVTDPYLIQLSEEIWSYSTWIKRVALSSDFNGNGDTLMFEYEDIDNCKYCCDIYQDLSFKLLEVIEDEFGENEYIEIYIPNEIRLNHNRILNYLQNMPRTFASSF